MGNLLEFRTMITPAIIKFIFIIGLILILLGGLVDLASGSPGRGLGVLLIGPLVLRIYCEILIVIFSIHERLGEIRDGLGRG